MTTPHDYFGSMELVERQKSYRAVLDFPPRHKVSVTIDWLGIAPTKALKRSQEICERVRARELEYRSKIAHDLLRDYNDDWRDGEMLDADGFMHRISLSHISISPIEFGSEGCVSLYYSDGNLFAGHSIQVVLDRDFRYVTSQIAG